MNNEERKMLYLFFGIGVGYAFRDQLRDLFGEAGKITGSLLRTIVEDPRYTSILARMLADGVLSPDIEKLLAEAEREVLCTTPSPSAPSPGSPSGTDSPTSTGSPSSPGFSTPATSTGSPSSPTGPQDTK